LKKNIIVVDSFEVICVLF